MFCIDNLVRGGTELQVIGLIERLDRDKYEPYLLTIRETDPNLVPENCVHLDWNVNRLFSVKGLGALVRLAGFLRSRNISIVQTYFQDSTIFAGIASCLARVPIRIACFRDMAFWENNTSKLAISLVYRCMTHYLCNAAAVRERFIKLFGLKKSKFSIVPNGVDASKLEFLKHSGDATDIAIIGNMTREVKRVDLFLDAASEVLKEFPSVRFHVVGDGDLRPSLEEQTERSGIRDKVNFTGRIADVGEYLKKIHIGIICSDSEGLSNAILEYMFRGVACIATEVGGNPELVLDGETGVLVAPGDPIALSEAIKSLLTNNDRRESIARSARAFVEERYSWNSCISAHERVYCSF